MPKCVLIKVNKSGMRVPRFRDHLAKVTAVVSGMSWFCIVVILPLDPSSSDQNQTPTAGLSVPSLQPELRL